jgi:branched-chain amino acid aminotransferase|tara:strand:+ start:501 stop:1328 length:828 start_codon:yes stop_codon:yes gene_type:complete
MKNKIIFINDEFLFKDQAKISFEDGSFQKGNAIFESIRFQNKKVLQIDRHLERLFDGLNYFNFKICYSYDELAEIINELIKKNNLKSGIINFIVSDTFDINNPIDSKTNIYISLRETNRIHAEPVKIIFVNENDYPVIRFKKSIKINNYAGNIRALRYAKKHGCYDAVFYNNKKIITESTMRNIFFIKQNKIITPPLSLGILNGTTRQMIKEICDFHGYEYQEKFIKLEEIMAMDEAFLTSCAHGLISCFWDGWNNANNITPKIKIFLKDELIGS